MKVQFTKATVVASIALSAWSGLAQADNRPVLRVAVQQIATTGTLSTLREQSNVGARSLPMIYAGLIELDRQGDLSLKPGLAASWKRIDDRTVELKLRKGAKFHNGDEVTAEDVAFTFSPQYMFGNTQPMVAGKAAKTIRTDASAQGNSVATTQSKPLELPPEVSAIARRLWPSLAEVQVIDRYTVRFINAVPDVTMEGRIARSGSEIISKKAFLAAKDWMSWARSPVSALSLIHI